MDEHRRKLVPLNDLARDDGSLALLANTARDVVMSGAYLGGPHTRGLEQELGAYLGGKHVIGVGNGTDALGLALLAAGLPPEAEVLVPANAGGYASVAGRVAGLTPVVADVDHASLLVTRATLEAAATDRTRAVVVTHLYGQVVHDLEVIREWCDAEGFFMLEDCAQAAGAQLDGLRAGTVGHAAAFSFYPTKNLAGTGDAGAVATSDAELAARVRRVAQYGWHERYRAVMPSGRNSRIDELQAAVLRIRLPRLGALNDRRQEIGRAYAGALGGGPLRLIGSCREGHVWHLAVLLCDDRARVQTHLEARQVASGIHYPFPDHLQPGLQAQVGSAGAPIAEDACARVLTVPCFPTLTDDEVGIVVRALADYRAAGAA